MSSQVKIHAHFEVMYHHKLVSVDIPILLTITGYLKALLATLNIFRQISLLFKFILELTGYPWCLAAITMARNLLHLWERLSN